MARCAVVFHIIDYQTPYDIRTLRLPRVMSHLLYDEIKHCFLINLLMIICYKPDCFVVRQGVMRLLSFVMICKFHTNI